MHEAICEMKDKRVSWLQGRFIATLCDECADRLLSDWMGLTGCTRVRVYNGGKRAVQRPSANNKS